MSDPGERLRAAEAQWRQCEERLEDDLERAREARHQAIRDAYAAGLTMQAIAAVCGLSHQRVSQILRGE